MPNGYVWCETLGGNEAHSIYLVRHKTLFLQRIIKEARRGTVYEALLRRETDILLQIQNPHVPEVYDFCETEQSVFLIEEYMEGTSLQTYRSDHDHVSTQSIYEIGMKLCDFLAILHNRQDSVFYLDLKPEHILLCGDKIRVVDFGAAVRKSDLSNRTQVCGTPGFFAPEQGMGGAVDERSDIYALGMILHFLLHGSAREVSTDTPVANELVDVIQKATAEDPAERFSDVFQIKDKLKILRKNEESILTDSAACRGTQIAVIGSESHIGVTHIAMQLNVFLNETGRKACYYSLDEGHALNQVEVHAKAAVSKYGRVQMGHFLGDVCYREGERQEKDEVQVLDLGIYDKKKLPQLEKADIIFLIAGAKPWEQENSARVITELSLGKPVQILLNFSEGAYAKAFCRKLKIEAAQIPFLKDPFRLSKEDKRFYAAIWKRVEKG